MSEFFLNQRYTSNGEPELGVGSVMEVTIRTVKLFFPACKENRTYSIDNAPLKRVVFKQGDTISDKFGGSLVVERVQEKENLYDYFGTHSKISESDLGDVLVTHGVEDRLLIGDIDTPQCFSLRRETLDFDHRRRLSAISGFLGGRIDLIPHQLYIAHEVSMRYAPRVLLSDQVGLGKTIEACMILHRLLLSGRVSRVIILVPDSLIHQWFVELLRRFNLWFTIFDEVRCASLEGSAPENNPFLDTQLILCSIEFLAKSEKRTQEAIDAGWDMLVVDEAHHLEWSLESVSPEYAVVEQLSLATNGLLLLTATPEQLGEESHFARLRLLDRNRYVNFEDFLKESADTTRIATIVEKLHQGKKLLAKDIKLLSSFIPKERLSSLCEGDDTVKDKIIEDLLDQYGPGRVLFRNTRLAMSGFPQRKAHFIPLEEFEDNNSWTSRLHTEFMHDYLPAITSDEQLYCFESDLRVKWLQSKIKELYPSKILLICKSKEKVLALEEVLTMRGSNKVGVFHDDLSIVQRDRNAAWFSEEDGAQILLCSEIGSEGRNFQFAHHLILFDLPFHPELLEQRIGRLDRIGQTEDIHIYIPYLVNSPQHMLARWYHEGLNAFELNVEGGNEIWKKFSDKLLDFCQPDLISEKDWDELISETSIYRKELMSRLSNGRDKLIEMNSFRPAIAQDLVTQIQNEDKDKTLEKYFTKVLHHFDVEMEDLAARTYFLHPSSEASEVFPSIPREGICVTFDRKRALIREDISFLSWDHPMTTGAIDMVLSSGTGSASFGVLRGAQSSGILLELIFVLETTSSNRVFVDRFLPRTPIRIVVDHTGKDLTDVYTVKNIENKLVPGDIEPLLDNEMLVENIIPKMIASATKIAEMQRDKIIVEDLQKMNFTLNHEIDRLKVLQQKNNNIRPDEIQVAIDEQAFISELIRNAQVRLDAIQLILKQ